VTIRLNGWQRLWILIGALWLMPVIGFGYLLWPTEPPPSFWESVGTTKDKDGRKFAAVVVRAVELNILRSLTARSTPQETAAEAAQDETPQQREDEFRQKERCAAAAVQWDHTYSASKATEVFYSPMYNTCLCEAITEVSKGVRSYELHDCFSRASVDHTIIATDRPDRVEQWRRGIETMKSKTVHRFKPEDIVTDAEYRRAMGVIRPLLTPAIRQRQRRFIGEAFAAWVLPIGGLYLLGGAIAWVRRGFRG
jgi:hypothetical protein